MQVLHRFPLPVLQGMRAGIARLAPDADGVVWCEIPAPRRDSGPYRLSTNKDVLMTEIDAAIQGRRSKAAGGTP